MKLNLGCSNNKIKGYINCDISQEVKPDKIFDLEKKFPFKDNSIDKVLAHHILEHLENPLFTLKEIYRVCKNGAKINIKVPHFSSASTWGDLTHKRGFSYSAFDYLAVNKDKNTPRNEHEYNCGKFILKKRLIFGKLHKFLGIQWFANEHPKFFESFLAYLFPPREIEFKLIAIKK